MIEFQNVSKRYGTQEVLIGASFQIIPGEAVGIVGPNGMGKTTLFELIVGAISPDGGSVTTPRNARLGYLHQQLDTGAVETPLLAYVENAVPAVRAIENELHEIESRIQHAGADERDSLLRRLGELQTQFEHMGGYQLQHRAAATLGGLGFPEETFGDPLSSLSGGWQMRAELARCLTAAPDIMLLDEPSNYLDVPAVEWLQRFLREFKGTLVLISHDRYLLNSLTSATIEVLGGYVERYSGNYDNYVQQRQKRYEQRLANVKNVTRKREKAERFIERFGAKATKASQVKSKAKMLERMGTPDVGLAVPAQRAGRIRLAEPTRSGHEVIRLEGAGATYDRERWVLRGVDVSIERGDRTALIGLNGMGKTTLLRLLTGQMPLADGRRVLGHKVVIGYQSQEFTDTMNPSQTVLECVKSVAGTASEQQVRTLLGGFGFPGSAVEKAVGVLSGGEKVRVAFARLLVNPPNFLVLDEPTTHLDIAAREALEQALVDFSGTLCFVSHDIEFVRRVATSIIAMRPPGIQRYVGGYDYYCEKIAAEANADESPDRRRAQPDTARKSAKELRQERARERQARSNESLRLRKAIKRAESQLAVFETEQAKLLEQLQSDDDGIDYADVNRRLGDIQREVQRYTGLWEESSVALEELNG